MQTEATSATTNSPPANGGNKPIKEHSLTDLVKIMQKQFLSFNRHINRNQLSATINHNSFFSQYRPTLSLKHVKKQVGQNIFHLNSVNNLDVK